SFSLQPCAFAEDLFARFSYRTWTQSDGLGPSDVTKVVQDRTGYLWVATVTDLLRFDGVRFTRWTPEGRPLSNVRVLVVDHDGSLWLGFSTGGVARLKNGMLERQATSPNGLFDNFVTSMLEDRHGSLWVGGQGGLAEFDGTRWRHIGQQNGLPER